MEEQIRSWIASLAEHETFRTWTRATMDIQGLGPGTHGWLVTLLDKRLPIGYLVVYAGEDGSYRLGEYGLGPAELYNRATLRRSLEENGLVPASGRWTAERRYAHPLAAAWRVAAEEETYWLDAKTGELLPLDDPAWARIEAPEPAASAGSGAVPSGRIATWRLSETFDPYERLPWLTGEEAAAEKLLTRLLDDGRHLRFVSEPFGELMLYALPVVGYVRWTDGRIDLALDQNGVRWIPLDTLRSLGLFYR